MIHRGEISHIRTGRRVLVDVRDLEEWIATELLEPRKGGA